MVLKSNYYFSSFIWTTVAKVLTALFEFLTVPILLGIWGKSGYGIIVLATSFNGYMQLLDLGMNVGAVKHFSQWLVEDKRDILERVYRTNLTFYLLISLLNAIILILTGMFGRELFSINENDFLQLRYCLYILAFFSFLNWSSAAFNQLLIADKQMAFTMQMQCIQAILKFVAIAIVLFFHITISQYFFILSLVISLLVFPYALKCKKDSLIQSFIPAVYWADFKIVFTFSMSIFALSLFQATATQIRPIILGLFSQNSTAIVAEYKILAVIPSFIIMIGGTFSGIFLPKSSERVSKRNKTDIDNFAYKWTSYTSILANILCVPFFICAKEALSAYVGSEYSGLSMWLVIWVFTVLLQIHTTPTNSLVLAYGKTKKLVITTAFACCLSVLLNIFLIPYFSVGAAIIAYLIYVIIIIGLYYLYFYKYLLGLNRRRIFRRFFKPTFYAVFWAFIIYRIPINVSFFSNYLSDRFAYISICFLRTLLWIIPYTVTLIYLKMVNIEELRK